MIPGAPLLLALTTFRPLCRPLRRPVPRFPPAPPLKLPPPRFLARPHGCARAETTSRQSALASAQCPLRFFNGAHGSLRLPRRSHCQLPLSLELCPLLVLPHAVQPLLLLCDAGLDGRRLVATRGCAPLSPLLLPLLLPLPLLLLSPNWGWFRWRRRNTRVVADGAPLADTMLPLCSHRDTRCVHPRAGCVVLRRCSSACVR